MFYSEQKQLLGGFVSMDQMTEIWGLSPEVVFDLNKYSPDYEQGSGTLGLKQ